LAGILLLACGNGKQWNAGVGNAKGWDVGYAKGSGRKGFRGTQNKGNGAEMRELLVIY
jgi:hypothetical protein